MKLSLDARILTSITIPTIPVPNTSYCCMPLDTSLVTNPRNVIVPLASTPNDRLLTADRASEERWRHESSSDNDDDYDDAEEQQPRPVSAEYPTKQHFVLVIESSAR